MANSSPVYDRFQERLEIQDIVDDISSNVPPHVNIFYCLGGITLVCFLIQFATGFAMTFYYKLTVAEGLHLCSVPDDGCQLRLVDRSATLERIHDGADADPPCLPVYLTGGFKRPRELTWVTGVTMAVITVSFGVTGYSLPWDQVGLGCENRVRCSRCHPSGWRLHGRAPRGGESVGQSTLTRFYSLHTFVMPWLLLLSSCSCTS